MPIPSLNMNNSNNIDVALNKLTIYIPTELLKMPVAMDETVLIQLLHPSATKIKESLQDYCRTKEFSSENLNFFDEVIKRLPIFKANNGEEIKKVFAGVITDFIRTSSVSEINLPSAVRRELEKCYQDADFDIAIFKEALGNALAAIAELVNNDSTKRFVVSSIFSELVNSLSIEERVALVVSNPQARSQLINTVLKELSFYSKEINTLLLSDSLILIDSELNQYHEEFRALPHLDDIQKVTELSLLGIRLIKKYQEHMTLEEKTYRKQLRVSLMQLKVKLTHCLDEFELIRGFTESGLKIQLNNLHNKCRILLANSKATVDVLIQKNRKLQLKFLELTQEKNFKRAQLKLIEHKLSQSTAVYPAHLNQDDHRSPMKI